MFGEIPHSIGVVGVIRDGSGMPAGRGDQKLGGNLGHPIESLPGLAGDETLSHCKDIAIAIARVRGPLFGSSRDGGTTLPTPLFVENIQTHIQTEHRLEIQRSIRYSFLPSYSSFDRCSDDS